MRFKSSIYILAIAMLLTGSTFKVMHWPFATLLINAGLGLGVFMLILEVSLHKKSKNDER